MRISDWSSDVCSSDLLYSPKTHNLNRLRDLAEELEPSLKDVWPRETRFEKRCYALLRDAYVKARYSRSYHISQEQLDWIAQRVALLQSRVREACEMRIENLPKAAQEIGREPCRERVCQYG